MSDNLLVCVQARMGGSRFPGKVLAPLLGQPMLLWQLDRVARMQTPHTLVVACPPGKENEAIIDLCHRHGYLAFAPERKETDVLARFQSIAEFFYASEVVRLTADCPLVDSQVIDQLIAYHRCQTPVPDHTGIAAEWPDGCDAEIFSRNALEIAHAEATLASEREHVTSFLWSNRHRFRLGTFPCPFDLSLQQYSVDTPDDLRLVTGILERCLERHGHQFGWREIADVLRTDASLAQLHAKRAPRNSVYTMQVAQEQGLAEIPRWEELRYGA